MSTTNSVFRIVDLSGGGVIPFIPVAGERVRILHGRIWLTEEGCAHDAFLESGEEMRLRRPGRLAVIEAMGPARIQLERDLPMTSRLARSAATLARRSTAALRRARPRLPRPAGDAA